MAGAAALAPVLATFQAAAQVADLALMCDLTLGEALRHAAEAYRGIAGVRIHIFPTAPGLIVPMLTRDVRIDIVVTRLPTLDLADKAGVLAAGTKSGTWSTPLVVAEAMGAPGSAAAGTFAVSELPAASGIDARAALAHLGIDPARVVSAIDTTEVAFLLTTGGARSGLLYLTDAKAEPRLRVVQTLTDPPPAMFGIALKNGASRANPSAFVAFLGMPATKALMSNQGLAFVA